MYQLLQGVRVIDFSTWLFVPSGGAVLADWGADVIKIEDAAGPDPSRGLAVGGVNAEGIAPMVEFANRGKRSVGLDIRTEGGLELLYRLVAGADVFMTNVRTSATERIGIDVASLRKVNPKIICVRGTGFGQVGPKAGQPAFDVSAAWAAGGAAFLSARTDNPYPPFPAGSYGDTAGGLAAAGAVAAALFKRDRTGEPSTIDIALQAIGMWMMGPQITLGALGMLYEPFRQEAPANPLVNAYRSKDRRWLYFSLMQADRFWPDFCRYVGLEHLIDDPLFLDSAARAINTEQLVEILNGVFAQFTMAQWVLKLEGFDGVWGPDASPAEIPDDPHVRENGFVVDVEYADGVHPLVATPAQFDEQRGGTAVRAPRHGEHTDEVLAELGLSMDEILKYKLDGAVL
ncbi:MAG: fldA 4 [Pseudonocardiales bacterium]|nr:fldA 4 [Pseudonocardiales bacterium]